MIKSLNQKRRNLKFATSVHYPAANFNIFLSPDRPISAQNTVRVYRKTTSDSSPVVRQSRLRNPQESLAMFVRSQSSFARSCEREKKKRECARTYGETYTFKISRVHRTCKTGTYFHGWQSTQTHYGAVRDARPRASGFRLSICSRFGNGRINDRAVFATRREFCNDTFKSRFRVNEETTVVQ